MPNDSNPLESNTLIGSELDKRYRILSPLGKGGMGAVFLGEHMRIGRQVAIKVLNSELASSADFLERFEREAIAAGRLDHPNCVPVTDSGHLDNGTAYLVMEYVDGESLGAMLKKAGSWVEPVRALRIIRHVLRGLGHAHDMGIVHRDVKPDNIMLCVREDDRDFARVLDFGIAKIIDPEPGDDYQALTRDGIVCGTPAYMSPEQVQGFTLDNRSDLFSLGIILYQTLTGQLPFFAESAVEVATLIVIEEPVPPSQARLDWSYPVELELVVLKLLAKKKEERYSSAIDVRDDLMEVLATLESRRDASLDLNAAELHDIMSDADSPVEGSATLQLSADMIARAMATEAMTAPPKKTPAGNHTPPKNPSVALMTTATSARNSNDSGGRGALVGGFIVALAAAGAGAWWFLNH